MKKSKLVIGLYVIAGLLGVVTIYMVISSIAYLSSYAQSYGMSISDLGSDAYSYVITNSINYLIYGIIVFAAAKILDEVRGLKNQLCAGGADASESAACADENKEEPAEAEEDGEDAGYDMSKVPPLYTSNTFLRH